MPPAIIAGGIAAVGTIGGALLSSHAQSSAASQAAQSQNQATAAQLQLGQQSLQAQTQLAQQALGLNQSIYNSNYDTLSPFVARGNAAGDAINALLGLPKATPAKSPLETASGGLAPIPTQKITMTAPGQQTQSGPTLAQVYALKNDGIPGDFQPALAAYNAAH